MWGTVEHVEVWATSRQKMDALLIRTAPITKILAGTKTWEIRGTRTHKRGRIALVESGTGTVVGVTEIVDAVGPLSATEFVRNAKRAGLSRTTRSRGLPYARTFAWVLRHSRKLLKPVPYRHPPGAVIWVRLDTAVERAIQRQLT
jgi:hypothetical protein